MIKLFWNTQNQSLPKTKDPNDENVFNYQWGIYHKKNSDKWIFNILNKIKFHEIKNINDIDEKDTLIIVDSSVDKKIDLYSRLRLMCSRLFLIHLGDERGMHNLDVIYNNCNFVWRTFCTNRFFNREKIKCFPIGYKSGVLFENLNSERKYKWSFLGTPHKSSRHDLLFQLSNINPSFCHRTKKFNTNIIETNEMNKILSSTIFSPCPNGLVHPETYRLYEALECECIPIVENTYKYYDRLFPNNPFVKIDKWAEAKKIINSWTDEQIKIKQKECNIWWKKLQNDLQDSISSIINKQ